MPETAKTIPSRSCHRLRFTPETTPISTPTTVAQAMATTVSQKVGMKRSPISSATGRLVLVERPRSPCSVFPM